MNTNDDQQFINDIKLSLDESIKTLDDRILARLDSSRQAALKLAVQHTDYAQSSNDELALLIKTKLDASVAELSPEINGRLNKIRSAALARAPLQNIKPEKTRNGFWSALSAPRLFIPASAFASACVLIVVVSMVNFLPQQNTVPFSVSEEISLLASADDLELYENLEFYLWLADNGSSN